MTAARRLYIGLSMLASEEYGPRGDSPRTSESDTHYAEMYDHYVQRGAARRTSRRGGAE